MDESVETAEELYLTDKEIFLKIWTTPRPVFKYINDNSYGKYVTVLLVFAGMLDAFDRATTQHMGNIMPVWGVLLLCICGGALFGWISYYIYAALLSWTGSWLKGEGNTDSILRVLAYALIPTVLSLIPLALKIAAYGNGVFTTEGLPGANWSDMIFQYGIGAVNLVLNVCTLVLYVVGISEVQKFSVWKAILNLLLPILIIGVPIYVIVTLATGSF